MKNIRRRIRLTSSHFVYIYNMLNNFKNENFFYKFFSLCSTKNVYLYRHTCCRQEETKEKIKIYKMHTFIDTQKEREKKKKKCTHIQTHNRKRVMTKKKKKKCTPLCNHSIEPPAFQKMYTFTTTPENAGTIYTIEKMYTFIYSQR